MQLGQRVAAVVVSRWIRRSVAEHAAAGDSAAGISAAGVSAAGISAAAVCQVRTELSCPPSPYWAMVDGAAEPIRERRSRCSCPKPGTADDPGTHSPLRL